MTRLIRYSTELYSELEAETGLATGWKNCGSLSVARTAERLTQLKRTAAVARAYGVACEVHRPARGRRAVAVMRTDDLVGRCLAAGRRQGQSDRPDPGAGARRAQSRRADLRATAASPAIVVERGAARGVTGGTRTGDEGRIRCDVVVNCAGQWARAVGRLCGVAVPLHSAEHYYIVTERDRRACTPDLPVMRDPDGYVYFKEEVGGLVMGGFEPDAKPWGMDGIPDDFEFQLLPEDWDQFELLMDNAIRARAGPRDRGHQAVLQRSRVASRRTTTSSSARRRSCGNFYVGAGFNSMGIASAGGAGLALAEWIVAGEPTMDLWPVDIRRFARFNGNDRWLGTGSRKRSDCTTRCRGRTANSTAPGRYAARRCTRC